MPLNTLSDLFRHRLNVIYDAQQQLPEFWPKLAESAENEELKTVFAALAVSSKKELERLDTVFEKLGLPHDAVQSKGMRGIVDEAREMLALDAPQSARDAAFIEVAQEIKHYEMAIYGSVRTWAKDLDESKIGAVFQDSLNEQGDIDKRLTSLAEGGLLKEGINAQAPRGAIST